MWSWLCVLHIFQQQISQSDDVNKIGLVIVNTILGGAMGGVSTLLINRFIIGEGKKWSYLTALNGTLTGKLRIKIVWKLTLDFVLVFFGLP